MSEELDTVNPTHLLMIDYVARLEKKVAELKRLNELWEARFNNMEILYKNAKGDYQNESSK